METVSINKDNALKAYNSASGELKEVLAALFGKQVISQNPMDRFKTFEDVCDAEGWIATEVLPFSNPMTPNQVHSNGAFKLALIFEAFNKRTGDDFNELWEPDYANARQYKYYPWFEWVPSLSAFVYAYTYCTGTYTFLGARLCTENDDYATYIGKQFAAEWNEFLNPQI